MGELVWVRLLFSQTSGDIFFSLTYKAILWQVFPCKFPPTPPPPQKSNGRFLEFGLSHEKFDDWRRPLSCKQYLFFHVQSGKRGKVQHLRANWVHELFYNPVSLRGRRLKRKGKGVLGKRVLGARETRGAREEGGRETPARKPLFFSLLTSTRRMLKSWLVKIW